MSKKIKPLLYEYAYDQNGVITHIDDATEGCCYKCIECQEILIIKNGGHKRKHFAHKSNSNCDGESYIHKIWKKRIKDIFYSDSPFVIKYPVFTYCEEISTCPIKKSVPNLNCNKGWFHELDLKKEYDTCEEEVEYKGFVGDLVLTNSKDPEKEPLFIEIDYTHPCDEEKIASKIKIIELKVIDDREREINWVEQKDWWTKGKGTLRVKEGNPYDTKHLPDVRFYNFNRLPYPTISVFSFVHIRNGQCEMQYSTDCTCKEMPQKSEKATFAVAMATDIVESMGGDYYIESILALAALNKHIVRDCRLCSQKIYQDIFHRKCKAMTEKGFASAQLCRYYKVRRFDVKRLSDRLRGIPYKIITE